MKRIILLLPLLALAARADGFFDPPAPAPERVAALDALCARLEALGMPAVPPDAEWVFLPRTGSGSWTASATTFPDAHLLPIPFFGSAAAVDGNAWRWRPAPDAPALVLTVFGDVLSGEDEDAVPSRLGRATAGLRAALAARPEGFPSVGKAPESRLRAGSTWLGSVVLFSAQLHRHGETAEAAAFLGLLDGTGRGAEGEASASNALGRAHYAALLRSPARTNDLPAFAAALEENLARFPDAYANCSSADARFADLSREIAENLAERFAALEPAISGNDPRAELLAGVRSRIAAADTPVPGVPADLQDLVRALDAASADELWNDAFGPAVENYDTTRLADVPWLLPEACSGVFPWPSNAISRIRLLGPRALDLLLPLLGDRTLVDGDWAHPPYVRSANFTRADAAESILRDLLPEPVRDAFFDADPGNARDAALRALVPAADAEERFLFYLWRDPWRTPWHVLDGWDGLLLAWLAERAAEGPLPKVEARLEAIAREATLLDAWDQSAGIFGPQPQRALCLALFYAAFRGEAAAPFRDRVLAALRDRAASWEPPSGPVPVRDALGNGDGETIEHTFKDPDRARRRGRAWFAKWADGFAAVPLGPSDPAALRARAAELAAWLRCAALVDSDDKLLLRPDLDAVPPAPGLLRAVVAPFPSPDDLQTDEERDAGEDGEENPDDFSWYVSLGPGSVTYRSGSSSGEDEYEEEFDDFDDEDD